MYQPRDLLLQDIINHQGVYTVYQPRGLLLQDIINHQGVYTIYQPRGLLCYRISSTIKECTQCVNLGFCYYRISSNSIKYYVYRILLNNNVNLLLIMAMTNLKNKKFIHIGFPLSTYDPTCFRSGKYSLLEFANYLII